MLSDVFFILAVLGGVIVVGQLAVAVVAGVIGHQGDSPDAHHDLHIHDKTGRLEAKFDSKEHAGGWLFGMLSLRALATALAVFGLIGLAALSGGFSQGSAVLVAAAAAVATAWVIGQFMRTLHLLSASGSLRLDAAVDKIGEVYVPVPGEYQGRGKVTLELQGRTVELEAVTFGPKLPTGTSVRVVQLVDPQTVEVIVSPFTGNNP